MKQLAVLFAVIAAAQAFGDWNEGLSVRFGVNVLGFGSSYFITVPRTVAEAKTSRWVLTERPSGPLPSLILYCPSQNDRTLCALFDDTNTVAGLQIAIPVDDIQDAIMDWEVQGYTQWTPPANSDGVVKTYWTLQQYFVSEASLTKSLEERIAARQNSRKILQEGAVWVTSFNGELLEISSSADVVADTSVSGFTKQACVILMGRHYYYNMTTTTECSSSTILPWFPLVHTGEIIGMGFMGFGKLNESVLVKDYFERPERSDVEMIVPDGPECLYALTDSPGVFTMHSYYIDTPWLINCINQ